MYICFIKDYESIDAQIANSLAPKLVEAGDVGDINPLYIVGEGKIISKLNTVTTIQALVILVGCYYMLNIEYHSSTRNVFLFLEVVLMDRSSEAKKRVAVNKFLHELD